MVTGGGSPAAARRGGGASAEACPWPLTEPHVDVAIHLFEALAQLVHIVGHILDPAGQVAHLLLEPIHPDLQVDGDITGGGAGRRRIAAVAVDLPLQHAEIALDPVEAFLHRRILRGILGSGILGIGHRHRRHRKHDQQQGGTGLQRDRAPNHQRGLWGCARPPGGGAARRRE